MARRQFSTGLPGFDEYLGGLFGGETFLAFISNTKQLPEIFSSAIHHGAVHRIPFVYISVKGSLRSLIDQHGKNVTEYSFRSKKQINALNRFVSAKSAGSYILLDELSLWKELLGKEECVVELFQDLITIGSRKNALILSAVLRSEFSPETLAGLKDSASVCLDFVSLRNNTYCVPLSLKGRYRPSSLLPLNFDVRMLQKSKLTGESLPPGPDTAISVQQEAVLEKLNTSLQLDYERTFYSAGEAMVLFDIGGDLIIANERCEQLLGYSPADWNARHVINSVSPEKRFGLLRFFISLKKKPRKAVTTLPVTTNKGKMVMVELCVSHVSDTTYLGILRDISDQFRMMSVYQEREDEYRTVLDRAEIGIAIISNNAVIYSNTALRTMLGYSDENEMNSVSIRAFVSPEALRKLQKIQREKKLNQEHDSFETNLLQKNGSSLAVRLSVSEILFQKKQCLQLSILNVGKQKEILDVLTASEKRFRAIVETANEAGAVIRDHHVVYVNKAFADLLHVERQENIIGTDITALVAEPDRPGFLEKLHKRSSKSSTIIYKNSVYRSDGTIFDGEFVFFPMSDPGFGEHILLLHDRTEQNKISAELRQQSEEMELLRRVIPSLQGSLDYHKLPHTALNSLMDVLSWGMGAIYLADDQHAVLQLSYQKNFSEASGEKLSHFEMNEGIGGYCAKTLEPHIFRIEKYPSFLPHRGFFKDAGVKELCLLPLVSNDLLEGIILFGSKKDLTGRKQSPALLSAIGNNLGSTLANARVLHRMKEVDRFRSQLIESCPDIVYSALPSGALTHVNASMERLVGYAPKEFYRDPALWLKLIHLDDKRIVLERTTHLHQLGHHVVNEYRVLPRGKASFRWVRDVITISKDNHGEIVQMYGTITDITDQKILLDGLRRDEALHSGILDELPDGIVAVDRSMKCIYWNAAMERLSGIDRQTAMGSPASKLLPGEGDIAIDRLLSRVLDGESKVSGTIRYHQPEHDGYFVGNFSPTHNQDGEITGAAGTVIDISRQKYLETEMRESEQILNNVVDTMGDVLLVTDLQGKILEVNRTFLRVLGYSRSEAVSREFPYPWLVEEEMGKYVQWIANLREQNWLHDFDMTWRSSDGRHIPMSVNTTLLRNSLGEPIAMLNIARDITERIRLAHDLANRNKQIEMVNRIISKANQTNDFDEIVNIVVKEIRGFLDADLVAVEMFHHGRETLRSYVVVGKLTYLKNESVPVEHSATQFVLPSGQPLIISDVRSDPRYKSLTGVFNDVQSQIIIPIKVKNKIIGTITIGSVEPYFFSEEHVQLFEPMAQQIGAITDRIDLVNQVTEDSTYIHTLLDSIDSVVFTVDMQLCIREVNTAWYAFMKELGNTGMSNVHGLKLFDAVPSEPLKMIYRNAVDQITLGSLRMFSQEIVHQTASGDRTYQLTINPMVIDRKVAGLVFTQTNITELKETEVDLKRSNEQLLIVNEISTSISTSSEIDEILREALRLLQRMTKSDGVIVYLNDENTNDLVLANQIGFDTTSFPSILRLQRQQSVTGDVVTDQRGIYIEDNVAEDERIIPQNRNVLHNYNIRAMAVVPLLAKDKILGALDMFFASRHEFSERERQVLTLVGNQLGTAVESAHLYGELRSQIDRLTLLYDFSQQLTSTLDTEQIFRTAYDHVRRVVPFTTFSIDLYDEQLKMTTPAFSVEGRDPHTVFTTTPGRPVFADPAGIKGKVVSNKEPYYSDDRKTICIPMMSKQMIIGIMMMTSDEPIQYGDTHRKLLESVGNLTAIAVEKGKLYEETVQKSSEIELRNKELDDFTYVVSHDLKEPLISIEGFSRILQSDYHDIIQPEGKEYFESIVGATTRMKGLIDDLLLLSRVSRPSESFKNVSVKQILDEITTDMEFTIRQKNVKVIIPENMPMVYGNETQLKIVFRNLIGNAVKFNDKAEPGVEIGFHNTENNSYLFFVKDNGIGIDREFYEKIFVIFQRLHRREQYEGSGAGLAIVKKIIESHKGSIWVESKLGNGSTFFFTIPKPLAAK